MNETGLIEETWQDKKGWGEGPWLDEPDRVEWRIGPFVGLALRNPESGNWCGYLGVPPGHSWHGKFYDDLEADVDVHGGLTFAAPCMEDERPQQERVCHVPQPDEPDAVWWLGFDCHHFNDIAPGWDYRMETILHHDPLHFPGSEYRTIDYVRSEILGLALQASVA